MLLINLFEFWHLDLWKILRRSQFSGLVVYTVSHCTCFHFAILIAVRCSFFQPERIDPPDPVNPDYDVRADVWSLGITLVSQNSISFPVGIYGYLGFAPTKG